MRIKITLSIGLHNGTETITDLLYKADKAMHFLRHMGKTMLLFFTIRCVNIIYKVTQSLSVIKDCNKYWEDNKMSENKTLDNLMEAFAGESQANRKYLAYAKKAEKDGKINATKL